MQLSERQEYSQAIRELDKAVKENPGDAMAYAQRGAAYAHQGELDRAISDLSEAIRLNPRMLEAYVNRW